MEFELIRAIDARLDAIEAARQIQMLEAEFQCAFGAEEPEP